MILTSAAPPPAQRDRSQVDDRFSPGEHGSRQENSAAGESSGDVDCSDEPPIEEVSHCVTPMASGRHSTAAVSLRWDADDGGPLDFDWATSKHRLSQSDFRMEERHFFRHAISLVWFQIVLVSVIATLTRGTTNALNAVGAFGTGDIYTATACNLLSSISFSCLSWLSGAVVNVVGCTVGCFMGAFSSTLLLTTLMLGTMLKVIPSWSVFFAATFDGIGSGVLWTAVGTVTIKYPSETRKGFATTILFTIFSTGAAMGGLLAFALNSGSGNLEELPMPLDSDFPVAPLPPIIEDNLPLAPVINAGIKPNSYIVMIMFTVLGVLLSFLVLPERKVHHRNGEPVASGASFLSLPANSREHSHHYHPSHSPVSNAIVERNSSRVSRYSMGSSFRLFSQMGGGGPGEVQQQPPPTTVPNDVSVRSSPNDDLEGDRPLWSGPPPHKAKKGLAREFKELTSTLQERSVQFLVLFSFASLFHQTYLFNGINYATFNVRTRGLNSFMYWIGRIPTGFVHGHLVDDFRRSTRRRALNAAFLLLAHVCLAQLLTLIFWTNAVGQTSQSLDIAANPANTALAFTAFFLYGGLDTVSQSFAMWLFSVLGRNQPSRIPHYVAVYRSFQGFGVAFAWFMDLNSFTTYRTQFLVCVSCWVLAMPGLFSLIFALPNNDKALLQLSRCQACSDLEASGIGLIQSQMIAKNTGRQYINTSTLPSVNAGPEPKPVTS